MYTVYYYFHSFKEKMPRDIFQVSNTRSFQEMCRPLFGRPNFQSVESVYLQISLHSQKKNVFFVKNTFYWP